jgi:hypothetical protein
MRTFRMWTDAIDYRNRNLNQISDGNNNGNTDSGGYYNQKVHNYGHVKHDNSQLGLPSLFPLKLSHISLYTMTGCRILLLKLSFSSGRVF